MEQRRVGLRRREFLGMLAGGAAAALGAPLILPRSVFGANEKINLAWVGIGNMGWGDLMGCAGDNNVVALCDCDPNVWDRAKGPFSGAKFYKDFRVMLKEMGGQWECRKIVLTPVE